MKLFRKLVLSNLLLLRVIAEQISKSAGAGTYRKDLDGPKKMQSVQRFFKWNEQWISYAQNCTIHGKEVRAVLEELPLESSHRKGFL